MANNNFDVVVLGGGPAGIVAAITAHRYYPDKNIVVVKSVGQGVIPCGIPYMFTTLAKPEENALGNAPLEKNNISVLVDEAISIDRKNKKVSLKSGKNMGYQKLVLAVGSSPIVPPIKGIDKKGVCPIYKDMQYLKDLKDKITKAKNVLILGGGFIGIEFADELAKNKDLNVSLAEILPHVLMNSFDTEFGQLVENKLKSKGVNLLTGKKVEEIIGNGQVKQARLSDGSIIPVDLVILGIGACPNVDMAKDAGLDLGKGKGIWVDEYMRTTDPDIFAVGDCAGKRDFFTRKDLPVMLASTATAEARIAGSNLYQLKVVRENKGTIAIYSTYVDGLALGSVGLTEASAHKEGFEVVVGNAEVPDKHPGSLPGMSIMKLKLKFSRQSGIILGGQVAGGISAGEVINVIGMAVQQRVSSNDLETLQMATHPYLTAAPTMYPLVMAAQDAIGKI